MGYNAKCYCFVCQKYFDDEDILVIEHAEVCPFCKSPEIVDEVILNDQEMELIR